ASLFRSRLRTAVAGRCWSWPRHTGSPPFVHHYQQVVWIRVGYAEIRAFTEVSRAQVHGERGRPRSQRLSWSQHRFLFILGVPAFGLALAYTMVTTYVPVIITQLSGTAISGVRRGVLGLSWLIITLFIGYWCDRTDSRMGGCVLFMVGGGAIVVAALIMMPLGCGSLTWI